MNIAAIRRNLGPMFREDTDCGLKRRPAGKLRVAVVQDYVSCYRVGFFSGLVTKLRSSDIELIVVAGKLNGVQKLRHDAASHARWMRYAESHRIHVRSMDVPFYGGSRNWQDCDGVIFTLRGNSPDLNIELLKKRFSHRRVATWGHVRPYVKEGNALDMAVERYQMRLSDQVFAYTPSGADFAFRAGVSRSKITTVMNSTDVSELTTESDSLENALIRDFELRNGLTPGKTLGYIGGVDAPKRIDFLVEVLDILWVRDPQVKLVVGGRGDQENLLDRAVARGQVIRLGYAGPKEKALINHLAEAVLNPGRIGLLAVECMAIGMPILTTDWKYHGPEYEYLTEGDGVFIAFGGPERFAELVLNCTGDPGTRRLQPRPYPTLDEMVTNFSNGVLKMMA